MHLDSISKKLCIFGLFLFLEACSSTPVKTPETVVGPGIGDEGKIIPVKELVGPGLSKYLVEPFSESKTIDVLVATNRESPAGSNFNCFDDSFGDSQIIRFVED